MKLSFNELKAEIEGAPRTWLPALLIAMVQACIAKKVFRKAGAVELVERVCRDEPCPEAGAPGAGLSANDTNLHE
jgi:hypothetical protein